MARDTSQDMTLNDLSDAEIERIEAMIFCMGGPPAVVSAVLLQRAAIVRAEVSQRR